MSNAVSRRAVLGAALAAPMVFRNPAGAQGADAITIAWPNDVPSWDPNLRFTPDAQSIFKAVYDQPLTQDASLRLIPALISKWEMAPDALSMAVELRDDVLFHDGSKMTAEDFRFTFFDRTRPGGGIDTVNSWRKVRDIEVVSPTQAVMRFSSPAPTAPNWLAFLGSFLVPKTYMTSVGREGFVARPVGTGPYRLAEYEMNARIVLERNDAYWGEKAKIRRVTFQVVRDPSARVAAVQSGQVDFTINIPVREATRLQRAPGLATELNPVSRIILTHCRIDQGFADPRIRLAAHHAVDKAALSQAFFGGAARPLSLLAIPGTSGDVPGFTFAYDQAKARALLAEAGFSQTNPAKITFATTNGHFAGDYDIARAMVQMWRRVGIEADLQVIEYAKYFELNRAGQLPDATLYTWDNASADPELLLGYMMNPTMPFSPSKDPVFGARVLRLFDVPNYDERIAGYRSLAQDAVTAGLNLPLLQSVVTVARKQNLTYARYENGWMLPQTFTWA